MTAAMLAENRLSCTRYMRAVAEVAALPLQWQRLSGKTVLLSGATGMVGTFLTDVLMARGDVRVVALGRSEAGARLRLGLYFDRSTFSFLRCDLVEGLPDRTPATEILIHAAGNTHPALCAADPVGTMQTHLWGTRAMLLHAAHTGAERVLFLSSSEVYGKMHPRGVRLSEAEAGSLDSNALRSGYAEAKRAGEALCQAYRAQYGVNVVIVRMPRVFGPTMLPDDSKMVAQLLRQAATNGRMQLPAEEGEQQYSYLYVADAVQGLLICLLRGENGEAYNLADAHCDAKVSEVARLLCEEAGAELQQAQPATEADAQRFASILLDPRKAQHLGFQAHYDLRAGLWETVSILRPQAARA